jgi:hypothetical protein
VHIALPPSSAFASPSSSAPFRRLRCCDGSNPDHSIATVAVGWCSGSACRLAVGHSPSAFLWPFAIRHSPSAIDSPQLSVQRKASPAVLPPPLPPLYLASPFPIRRCCRPSPLCSALQRSASPHGVSAPQLLTRPYSTLFPSDSQCFKVFLHEAEYVTLHEGRRAWMGWFIY